MGGRSLLPQKSGVFMAIIKSAEVDCLEIARKLKITRSYIYKYKNCGIFDAENRKGHKGGRPKQLNKGSMRNLVRGSKSL